MPIVKTEGFREKDMRLAALAKALSHPARVAILRELARQQECICGEIVDRIPLAQATVSQHLKELKNVGLIRGEVEGPRSCYCLNLQVVSSFGGSLVQFFDELRRCCHDEH